MNKTHRDPCPWRADNKISNMTWVGDDVMGENEAGMEKAEAMELGNPHMVCVRGGQGTMMRFTVQKNHVCKK